MLSETVAGQFVPVIGAVGGATINFVLISQFHAVKRGRFTGRDTKHGRQQDLARRLEPASIVSERHLAVGHIDDDAGGRRQARGHDEIADQPAGEVGVALCGGGRPVIGYKRETHNPALRDYADRLQAAPMAEVPK